MPDAKLTPKQLKAIHACRRSLDLSDQEYRMVLREHRIKQVVDPQRAGQAVTSSKDLSRIQARSILTRWQLRGAPVGGPYSGHRPAAGDPTTLATPAQRAQIERLKEEIQWRFDDGYERWLKTKLHITAVRIYNEAEAVIEGLKGMKKHGHAR